MRSTTASMTRLVAVSAFAALVSSGVALGQTPDRPGDGRNGDAQRPTQAAATAAPLDDRTFVTEMSIAGMAEVQLGELAQQRGEHADVKSFGQMMVKDHTQANNELTAIAKSAGLTPARELDQKHRDLMTKLSTLKGEAFDRAYMDAMVSGHEEVLMKLQQRTSGGSTARADAPAAAAPGSAAAGGGSANAPGSAAAGGGSANAPGQGRDSAQPVGTAGTANSRASLDQWAAKTAPVVKQHLQHARDIQKTVSQSAR